MFPWPIAHGDLGSADEIIPAFLAFVLLTFVLARILVEGLMRKRVKKHKPVVGLEPEARDHILVD